MKLGLIALNLVAAVAVVWAGKVVCGIHRAHSYSVYVELEKNGALTKSPKTADGGYDVPKRLETIGNLEGYVPVLTYCTAIAFLVNAISFLVLWGTGKRALARSQST